MVSPPATEVCPGTTVQLVPQTTPGSARCTSGLMCRAASRNQAPPSAAPEHAAAAAAIAGTVRPITAPMHAPSRTPNSAQPVSVNGVTPAREAAQYASWGALSPESRNEVLSHQSPTRPRPQPIAADPAPASANREAAHFALLIPCVQANRRVPDSSSRENGGTPANMPNKTGTAFSAIAPSPLVGDPVRPNNVKQTGGAACAPQWLLARLAKVDRSWMPRTTNAAARAAASKARTINAARCWRQATHMVRSAICIHTARFRMITMVAPTSSSVSTVSQPASIHWNVQKRLAGW